MSYSKQNVIRGLHLQLNKSQGKYLSVIKSIKSNLKTDGQAVIDFFIDTFEITSPL